MLTKKTSSEMREAPWWRPALNVLNLSCLILSSYKVLGILSHKNRSQQLSCNFFSCRWILLLQRILDHATLQPCRSLDHLQKDNKNLQGPGQRNQNQTINNHICWIIEVFQLDEFRNLQNNYNETMNFNFRPLQDLNGRKVDHYQ